MPDFDLNVERVLEHWTVAHAAREIIANALDEAALTGTDEPRIWRDGKGAWHIRDFGRGLRHEHLTQKENREKLQRTDLVGKFGVGLKDALATFDRRKIDVTLDSRHHHMTLRRIAKHGFEDLRTLHVRVDPPGDTSFVGTEITLTAARDEDIAEAKGLFLRYAGDEELEGTRYGAVLRRGGSGAARVYVNGVRVAEEPNFLFSYNVTSLTTALRRALNRERSNVGRTAYADRIKAILLETSSKNVADLLAGDLESHASGKIHDETRWLDVALHACRILNASDRVIFLSSAEILSAPEYVHHARSDGYRVVTIPMDLREKLRSATDVAGNPIVDLSTYRDVFEKSFSFSFVDPDDLTPGERAIFERSVDIIALQGKRPRVLKRVRISTTMRPNAEGSAEVVGVWDGQSGDIVIRRDQLAGLGRFAGTLLHELTHAVSGAGDLSSPFEEALTTTTGKVAEISLTGDSRTRGAAEMRSAGRPRPRETDPEAAAAGRRPARGGARPGSGDLAS